MTPSFYTMHRSYSSATAHSYSSYDSAPATPIEHYYSRLQQVLSPRPASTEYHIRDCPTPPESCSSRDEDLYDANMSSFDIESPVQSTRGPQPVPVAVRSRISPEGFVRQTRLIEHERVPTPKRDRPRCSICKRDYGRQADLSRHKRSVSTIFKVHVCGD